MTLPAHADQIAPERKAMLQILHRLGFQISYENQRWIIRDYDTCGWYTEKKVRTHTISWRLVRQLCETQHPALQQQLDLAFLEWLNNELQS